MSSWITKQLTYGRNGRCLRQRYFEHSRTYTGCFLCRWDTFLAGESCFRHSLEGQRVFSSRACGPWELECLTHVRLVSVFLDYSILSGSPFARALSLRKMKKFLLGIFHVNYFSRCYKINAFYRDPFFSLLLKKRRLKIKLSTRQWNQTVIYIL